MFPLIVVLSVFIVNAEKAVPDLPTRFSAIVEANIIQKNQTWIMEEWYDGDANKAKRLFYYADKIYTTYEDFSDAKDQLWSYETTHDDTSNAITCTLQSYKEHRLQFENDETSSGNLVSSAEWFQFGANFSETYIGSDFVIRGISAEGWTRDVIQSFTVGNAIWNLTYALTYYFAVPNWDWFMSSEHQIPIRVDLIGTRISDNGTVSSYDFHHYYDYIQFLADDLMLEEELTFDIPDFYEQCNVTSYCNVYNNSHICEVTRGPPLPTLPYSFTSSWEWSSPDSIWGSLQTSIWEMIYDYENERAHFIFRGFDGYDENAYHFLELLQEQNGAQVWSWIGDDIKDCAMFGASMSYTGWNYGLPVSNGSLLNPTQLLFFNDKVDNELSDEIWMGYTEVRGIPAEKWKSIWNVTVNGGESTIWLPSILPSNQRVTMVADVFWYFASPNWTFAYEVNDSVRPLAIEIKGTYEVYNYSDTLGWELVDSAPIYEYGHAFKWLKGTPDESWFTPPEFWRRYCDIDEAYCSGDDHDAHIDEDVCDEGLDLPTLPQHKYFVMLEGTDLINQTTHIIKTWYHYDTNEYRNEVYINNFVAVTYDELNEDRRWSWMYLVNDSETILSCNVVPFASTLVPGNEKYDEENADTGHIKAATDLWQFGTEYNITYLGNGFSVRGINARAWHKTSNIEYTVDGIDNFYSFESIFYFADNWDYYEGIESADIPLKVVFTGTQTQGDKVTEFDYEFHAVSFFSGANAFDEDEMEFLIKDWYTQCNTTTYCAEYADSEICTGKGIGGHDSDKEKDRKETSSMTLFIVLIPVFFLIGLCVGIFVGHWLVKRKGVASFKTGATANGGL